MSNKIIYGGIGILTIGIFFLLYLGLYRDPTLVPSPLIGKKVPRFELPHLIQPNQKITENSLQGKMTLLNVWASWCQGCLEEHAFLLNLAQKKTIRLVSLNYKDKPQNAVEWLKVHGDPYEWIAADLTGRVGIEWGIYGTPESFLINKKGIICYKHIGPLDAIVWQREIEPMIQQCA